jgi:serine/threonine-protein kinase RsbW
VVHSDPPAIQVFHLQVRTELEALIPVLQWFEETAKPRLLTKTIWELKLALAEGFTNTVCYAHDDLPPATPIDIELIFLEDILKIHVWNFGQPFDLEQKLAEISAHSVNPLEKESERGLLFMKALTDSLQYIRTEDGRNCLVLIKQLVVPQV